MEAEQSYESFEQDMQRRDSPRTSYDTCNCCLCMWHFIFCFKRHSLDSNRNRCCPFELRCLAPLPTGPCRRNATAGNQYRAPEIDVCSTIEVAHESEEDVRIQERGQLLPKDGHASAPPSSQQRSPFESKGESSSSGMKTLPHHRGKGSKGSGSFLEDIVNAAGGLVKGGSGVMLEDDDICPTCLDPYSIDNPKIWTRCGHHFHLACIFEWMERKDTCPMCESKMVLNDMDDEQEGLRD